MRYEYFQLARKHCAGFCQFLIDVDVQEAKRRNGARGDAARVPDDVIEKMARKFERPNPLQNPWEKFSFCVKFQQVKQRPVLCLLFLVIF
jgi:tRNA uridine 5-carbamoylmethylation protein Kti12